MPKVQPKTAPLGKEQKKTRFPAKGFEEPTENPLTIEERTELKGIFRNPVFVKALGNASLCKPPAFVAGLSTQLGGQISLVALARIQGWEMFSTALLVQTRDKIPPRAPLEENFADPQLPPIPPA